MKRALTVQNILSKKRNLMQFEGKWFDAFGNPELCGTWFIWGPSGHGKTTFTMELCKYLTNFSRVAYDSMEEGDSESIKMVLIRTDMLSVGSKFLLLDNEPIEDLKIRLAKRKSPQVIVIDSLQYSELTYAAYKKLKEQFPDKLFIYISHCDGKEPAGKVAHRVRSDAMIKIRVEGYRAFTVSRFGAKGYIDIWPEQAEKYHGIN